MMQAADCLIIVASWEDRFVLGLERTLNALQVSSVIVLFSEEYQIRTQENRDKAQALCGAKGVRFVAHEFKYRDAVQTWKSIQALFPSVLRRGQKVLFDISTSPRDLIWFALHHLAALGCVIHYVYYRPGSYGEWQSRDADVPRLIFKRSGVALPDRKTAILATTGFDADRIVQIVNIYEPALLLLAVQSGEQYDNIKRNVQLHRERFGNNPVVEFFEINAHGDMSDLREVLEGRIEPILADYNLIATSLGPKPSAIGLFELCARKRDIGLVYTPSWEYNSEYSRGIDSGEPCHGTVLVD
jgi:hypothetical protein